MKEITLLLVDDEQEFREATSAGLSRRGFVVVEAESGMRALEILEAQQPDIVVLDLRMDGMSGIDTLVEIRKANQDIPVVILTGHGELDDAVAGIQLGIADFLRKPVDVDHLATQIRGLLAKGPKEPLCERKVGELALSIATYPRIKDDRPIGELIKLLRDAIFSSVGGKVTEQGHRTVLVFDKQDRFVGCIRINDVLGFLLPPGLRGSPYASYLTGMFAGQCKMLGSQTVADLVEYTPTINFDAPLMEAVHIMVENQFINLPVVQEGEIVGMLRDKDLLAEAAGYLS
jgi:DNA-binding response OmpR family regulator